jgi:hypothetical protein
MAKGRKGRSKEQILKDRAEIASCYLQGWTQANIAAKVGLSRQQIGYDLEAIRQEWLQSSLAHFDKKKAEELARIDNLERVAWESFQDSKRVQQTTLSEQVTGDKGERNKASIRKVDQVGDPRFLAEVRWCIQKRCDIIGLDHPKKVAPTTPDGRDPYDPYSGLGEILPELQAALDRLGCDPGAENLEQAASLGGPGTAPTGPRLIDGTGWAATGPLAEEIAPLEFFPEPAPLHPPGGQEHGNGHTGAADGPP